MTDLDMDMEIETNDEKKVTLTLKDLKSNFLYITKGIETNQPRFLHRAIRQNVTIRKYINPEQLTQLVGLYVPSDHPSYATMTSFVEKLPTSNNATATDNAMELEDITINATVLTILPEVEVYLLTLIVTTLLRYQLNQEAAAASRALIQRIQTFNRRTLDVFSSKAYFYFSLAHEKIGHLEDIRMILMTLYRTSCVRHDEIGQAVLLNLLLRNYLQYHLIEQAHILSMRTSFPESASNNQFCRYLYYMGRIQAIQLDYAEAYQRLSMAVRKAPQGYAFGFTRLVHKWIVIVQLLMGEIPERSVFNQPELAQALQPYLELTQAVRNGDLVQFNDVIKLYAEAFQADQTYSLVQRLGHNVLKIGLKKLSISYSRISLKDIADKLHLSSASAAEYICAKAIKDGVIEAKIDHENGWITSHEILDLYSTEEPQRAFHKRIKFCLDVHNDAVKSMRYPPNETYKDKTKGDKIEESEKTIEELIKELEDDLDE